MKDSSVKDFLFVRLDKHPFKMRLVGFMASEVSQSIELSCALLWPSVCLHAGAVMMLHGLGAYCQPNWITVAYNYMQFVLAV